MNDWQALVDYAPWFLKPGEVVRVSEPSDGISLSHSLAELFPSLSILIAQASVTRVSIDETPHLLLGWDGIDGSRIDKATRIPGGYIVVAVRKSV